MKLYISTAEDKDIKFKEIHYIELDLVSLPV